MARSESRDITNMYKDITRYNQRSYMKFRNFNKPLPVKLIITMHLEVAQSFFHNTWSFMYQFIFRLIQWDSNEWPKWELHYVDYVMQYTRGINVGTRMPRKLNFLSDGFITKVFSICLPFSKRSYDLSLLFPKCCIHNYLLEPWFLLQKTTPLKIPFYVISKYEWGWKCWTRYSPTSSASMLTRIWQVKGICCCFHWRFDSFTNSRRRRLINWILRIQDLWLMLIEIWSFMTW